MATYDFYQSSNKDLGYTTQPDDMCKVFFDLDEELSRDSSHFIIETPERDGFEGFDFNFDFQSRAPNRESSSAVNTNVSIKQPERRPSENTFPVQSQRSCALRPHRVLPRSDQLGPSISGNELLRIEGKSHLNGRTSSPTLAPATPILRRKGTFCAPTNNLRGSYERVPEKASGNMTQPSYYCKQEVPSYREWTQRFGQISLQQPEAVRDPSVSPHPRTMPSETLRSPYIQSPPNLGHRKTVSEQVIPRRRLPTRQMASNDPRMTQGALQDFAEQAPVQAGALSDTYHNPGGAGGQGQRTPRHSRQSASWSQSPANFTRNEHTVTPRQLQTNWEDAQEENANSYFHNAVQTGAIPDYSMGEFSVNFGAYNLLDNDAFNGYRMAGVQQSHPNDNDRQNGQISSSVGDQNNLVRPETPPSRIRSTTPPPQDPPPSSRHSRPSKRRSKVGALRLPKSASNLKSTRSSRDLRSPRSAGALKSSKSTAGLRSPGEFGFVNFTPSDSGKILTGVAPSGSSKTKARREQEANEKKRRLSMAAEKAIREAGGDLEKLRQEGLL